MSRKTQAVGLICWLALCFAAPAVGAFSLPGEWYASLRKPAWNPPHWIFGPVWTALYTMMALAAWLVWRRGGLASQRMPLVLFLIQLALNAAWTPLFFGLHWIAFALGEIILLWVAIMATIRAFARVNRVATGLMLPYLAWVTFATVLNFELWRLNR